MARDTNLTRRGAVYYARVFVPKDLIEAMGKSELRPSLRTADYNEAKGRKAAIVDQWQATFDDMRRQAEPLAQRAANLGGGVHGDILAIPPTALLRERPIVIPKGRFLAQIYGPAADRK